MSATRQRNYASQKGSPTKIPCRVATTANVASLSGLLTIDTITVSSGDRVLVWQQGTPAENNIYLAASGAWTVAIDMSLADDLVLGMKVYIYDGVVYKDKSFHLTAISPVTFKQSTPIQVGSLTLTSGDWDLVSGLYEYDLSDANILSNSIVDVIPDNADIAIVQAAEVLPKTVSSAGSVKLYATNAPTDDIGITINIF